MEEKREEEVGSDSLVQSIFLPFESEFFGTARTIFGFL